MAIEGTGSCHPRERPGLSSQVIWQDFRNKPVKWVSFPTFSLFLLVCLQKPLREREKEGGERTETLQSMYI